MMLIEHRMTCRVHTVRPLDSIRHAREMMETYRINQLPVVHGGDLVGIITDRDLRDAYPSVFAEVGCATRISPRHDADPESIPVEIVMTPDVLTLEPGDSLADATRLMRRERIGSVPIVELGKLVGIITRTDVLDAFVESAGCGHAASAAMPVLPRSTATRAA